jgi:hypothetical protein
MLNALRALTATPVDGFAALSLFKPLAVYGFALLNLFTLLSKFKLRCLRLKPVYAAQFNSM